jgi:hypothetical protein
MSKKPKKKEYALAPLPSKLRIGVAEYDITHIPAKKFTEKDSDGEYALGVYKGREAEICVDTEMPPIRQVETYVHEALHMIFYEAGLFADGQKHKLINPVSIVLTRMLLENDFGWMHKWYLEQMGKQAKG